MPQDTHQSSSLQPPPLLHQSYRWVPALFLSLLLLALAMSLFTLHYIESQLVETKGHELSLAAFSATETIDRLMAERYGDVQMMAQVVAFMKQNPADIAQYFAQIRAAYPIYLWIGMTDRQGRIIAATDPLSVGQDRNTATWFQAAHTSPTLYLGDAAPSLEQNGTLAITLSMPVANATGPLEGVVMAQIGLPILEEVIAREALVLQAQTNTSRLIEWHIVDRTGTVLIDSHLRQEGQTNLRALGLPSESLARASSPGYIQERHFRRNVDVVTGYAHTATNMVHPDLGWAVLVRMDYADILVPIRATLWKLSAAGFVIGMPLVGLLFWILNRLQHERAQAHQDHLRASAAEQRQDLALTGADLGLWDWNLASGHVLYDARWSEMLGYASSELAPTYHTWASLLHPDDAPAVQALLDRHLKGATPAYSAEFRMRHKSGQWRWINARGKVVDRDAGGAPLRMTGTHMDITEQKYVEQSLYDSEARLHGIIDSAMDAIVTIDMDRRIVVFNRMAEQIFKWTATDIMGRPIDLLLPPQTRAQETSRIQSRLDTNAPSSSVTPLEHIPCLRATGEEFPTEASISTAIVRNRTYCSLIFRDITERLRHEHAQQENQRMLRAAWDERERMAMNLHDGAIQSLFAMGLALRESQALIGENADAARAHIDRELATLNNVIRELRESIIGGGPTIYRASFEQALADIITPPVNGKGLAFRLNLAPEALACLTNDMTEHLLFITREAVSNAHRHSHGTTGLVSLTRHSGCLRLVIADDGQGFDPRRKSGAGLGMSHMAIRADKLGAQYRIDSRPGHGVRIEVDIPYKEAPCPTAPLPLPS